MQSYLVGPMPVTDFLDKYTPNRKNKGITNNVFRNVLNVDDYDDSGSALNNIHLQRFMEAFKIACPKLHSACHAYQATNELSAGGVYPSGISDNEDIIMPIEVETALGGDFWRLEIDKRERSSVSANEDPSWISPSPLVLGDAGDMQNKIARHLTKIAIEQHRLHVFTLYLGRDGARIIRSERSGILVTDLISYHSEGQILLEWLLAFEEMSPQEQGFDPTARRLSEVDTLSALGRTKLRPFFPDVDDKPCCSVYEVDVYSDVAEESTPHRVLIWLSLFEEASTGGRGTRVYPCYDIDDQKVYLLKDSWRDTNGPREWEILRELNLANVPHVPTLIRAGELPGQITTLQDLAEAEWRIPFSDQEPIKARCHQRQLYKEVGRPLSTMRSPRGLMYVTYHAFIAHQYAYTQGKTLHRDVSIGNIIVVDWKLLHAVNNEPDVKTMNTTPFPEWRTPEIELDSDLEHVEGFLIDWELALTYGKPGQILKRTGTWQFMSARICMDSTLIQSVEDDIESFLYVTLYASLYCLPHSLSQKPSTLAYRVAAIFDTAYAGEETTGGDGKEMLLRVGLSYFGYGFHFESRGVNQWVRFVIAMYVGWYRKNIALREDSEREEREEEEEDYVTGDSIQIHAHTSIRQYFEALLPFQENWVSRDINVAPLKRCAVDVSDEPPKAKKSRM